MNPYLASRLVDDRLADDRAGLERPTPERGAGRGPAMHSSLRSHVDPAAWCLRATADPAGSPVLRPGGTGPGRVRRIAGWLLVDAGLRLAVGRRTVTLRG